MRADPLALGALTICVIAWLLAAAALTLSLVGRLPGSRARSVSAVRLQLTAMLTLTSCWPEQAAAAAPLQTGVPTGGSGGQRPAAPRSSRRSPGTVDKWMASPGG